MIRFGFPSRIANKIILLVLTLQLVSMGLWSVPTYQASKHELLDTISSKLKESAIRTGTEIGNFLDPLDAEIRAIAKLMAVLPMDVDDQKVLFQLLLNNRPEVEEISIVTAAFQERFRISRLDGHSTNLRDLSNFKLLIKSRLGTLPGSYQREISDISFSQFSEPQIKVLYPLTKDGEFILLKVNLKWLWDTVQNQVIGKSGYVYVLSDQLTLIAHQDPSLVLSGLSLAESDVPAELFSGTKLRALNLYSSFTNVQVAGVSYFDPLYKWWIVVEQPVNEGLAPLNRVINRFIVAFLLTVIIAAIAVIYFARRTMRPLVKLEQGIAELANGSHNIQIEVSGDSELASLTRSFNTMAASLDKHIDSMLKTQHRLEDSRQELQSRETQVRMLLNSTEEAIYGIDLECNLSFCNLAALRYLGYTDIEQVIGKPANELIVLHSPDFEDNDNPVYHIHNPDLLGKGIHSDNALITNREGHQLHVEIRSHPVLENQVLVGAVITFTNISERYSFQKEVQYQANHDSLTGLPNRKLLNEKLNEALTKRPPENRFSLIFIDLNRFKEINDTLGHNSGDNLLKRLGSRLQALLEGKDIIARLGGDEFAILLRSCTSNDSVINFAQSIATAITEPFTLEGMQIQVGASIGIAMCPSHARDGSRLMRFADIAMYYAKTHGLKYSVYDPELDAHSPRRLALTSELGNAIKDNHLTLHYQPKIRVSDQTIIGFEALVRWNHPEYGLLMPDQFIPLAELGDLINPLTLWVVNKAIIDRQDWSEQGWDFDVAVNISVHNLQDPDMIENIKLALETHGASASHLEFEITESSIMSDIKMAEETMQILYELGIRFSIDDYGTGYSSLAYLKKLPVDILKIDRSFIMEVTENDNDALIVRSTIELAHNLGLKVVAEGVENQDALDLLEVLRCDYAQGYYISRPMPLDDVIPWCNARAAQPELPVKSDLESIDKLATGS